MTAQVSHSWLLDAQQLQWLVIMTMWWFELGALQFWDITSAKV